jgi:hypothetical protein
MKMGKKSAVAICVGLLVLGAFFFWLKGCLAIDKCLDNGGRWNYERNKCEK